MSREHIMPRDLSKLRKLFPEYYNCHRNTSAFKYRLNRKRSLLFDNKFSGNAYFII
jgi:hypothetical protein